MCNLAKPFFSVIIPMYNREKLISRCLDSCLKQSFNNYEIIVVDDFSSDGSIDIVKRYQDRYSNIKLVKNNFNRGLCATRGEGVKQATGMWIMFLDSDDEFFDDAFDVIYKTINEIPDDVAEIRFCYWSEEHNRNTPIPLMPEGKIDFAKYLTWYNKVENSDLFYCHKRDVYDRIKWPENRRYSSLFFLELAHEYNVMMFDKVIGIMHNDATNRNTDAKRGKGVIPDHIISSAYDNAKGTEEVLKKYKKYFLEYAPYRYWLMKRSIPRLYYISGRRYLGFINSVKFLLLRPFDAVAWVTLFAGLLGPRFVLRLRGAVKKVIRGY